jgi:phage recombination protein Bet
MQTNTITPVQSTEVTPDKENLKEEIQTFILGGDLSRKMTSTQKDLCIRTSLAFNLNPLKREVHFIPYNGDIRIVVGYEVYLKRAEKSGKLDGWKVDIEGAGSNMKAVVTIHRKDWQKPFTHEVFLLEARQGTPLWMKMPRFMLKKVAIAQAFRLAFPEELGGLPYMPEEVGIETENKKDALHLDNTQHSQEYKTQTPNLDEEKLYCSECNAQITRPVKAYSVSKFKRALCMKCQKELTQSHYTATAQQ